jgi:predicted secreted protein
MAQYSMRHNALFGILATRARPPLRLEQRLTVIPEGIGRIEKTMHLPTTLLKKLLGLVKPPGLADRVEDVRSCRFVAVIDCILNQNARDCGAARFPAMNFALLQLCHEHRVGVLQMACPEIAALGFKRERKPGQTIREALDNEAGRRCCAEIACAEADRIGFYLAQGYELLAILGGNPRSPGCAVHDGTDGLRIDSGVFMKALQAELRNRNLDAPFKGMRDSDPDLLRQDLQWLREVFARKRN